MENKKIEEQIKNVVYTAVGAAILMAEKAKEVAAECEEKGKVACEKCEIKNEELKRDIKEKVSKAVKVTVVAETEPEDFIAKMDQLSEEEIAKIKEKLASMEAKAASSEETKEAE